MPIWGGSWSGSFGRYLRAALLALIMRPDFLFFSENASGEIVVDIVDPHGDHLADSLPKLRGLADYVEKHGADYDRIEAVAEVDGNFVC